MPKRTDISSILIIGAGPIVIGQACEFDYSGTQACKALKEEGYRVVLVNSNPATIMTDPDLADATYIEPITPEIVAKIIEKERPDALLPTMGGQTALNCALSLRRMGVLDKFNVTMIGATAEAIDKAEDRAAVSRGDEQDRARDAEVSNSPMPPTSRRPTATATDGRDQRTIKVARRCRRAEEDAGARRRSSANGRRAKPTRKRRYTIKALIEALRGARRMIGLPAIIRPSFTLGRHRRRHRLYDARNFSRSSNAASTPRRPPKC